MSKKKTVSGILAFPLIMAVLWQGGSCQISKMNSTPNQKADHVPTGTWGGDHIGLEVTDEGAEVEYDCAHGTINQQMVLDRAGNFNLSGTYAREHGGPVRRDEGSTSRPARYTGHIDGQTMTLTVTLTETNETLGTFTLTHGGAPQVTKCL
jgi:hypothetical protein